MMRAREINDVLARLASWPRSGVRRVRDATSGEPRYTIDFRVCDEPPPRLGRPWRAGLARAVPGCPSLFVISEYVGRRRVWLSRPDLYPSPRS